MKKGIISKSDLVRSEMLDAVLNNDHVQKELAANFDSLFLSVSPELRNKMSGAIAEMRAEYKLPHRAIKAVLFVAMLDVL